MNTLIDQLPARTVIENFVNRAVATRVLVITGEGKFGKSELSAWLCRTYRDAAHYVEIKGRQIQRRHDVIDRFNDCIPHHHRFNTERTSPSISNVTVIDSSNVIVGNNNTGEYGDSNNSYFDTIQFSKFKEFLSSCKFSKRVVFVVDNLQDADPKIVNWLSYSLAELALHNEAIDFILFARDYAKSEPIASVRDLLHLHSLRSVFSIDDIRSYFSERGKEFGDTLANSLDDVVAMLKGDPATISPLVQVFVNHAKAVGLDHD